MDFSRLQGRSEGGPVVFDTVRPPLQSDTSCSCRFHFVTLVLNKLVVTCQYCKRMSLNSNLITIAFSSLLSSEVVFKEIHLI